MRKIDCKNVDLMKKLKDNFENFFSLNLIIEKLKANPNFKETHWMRLLNDIKSNVVKFDLKFLTLQQVFDLNL